MTKSESTSEGKSQSTSGEAPSSDLFNKFRSTPPENITAGVQRVDGTSAKDATARKRTFDLKWEQTLNRVKRFYLCVLGIILSVATAIFVAGFFYLIYLWVYSFHTDEKKLGDFIHNVMFTILTVFATLFAESIFRGRK